jgi:hypothetical protein
MKEEGLPPKPKISAGQAYAIYMQETLRMVGDQPELIAVIALRYNTTCASRITCPVGPDRSKNMILSVTS